MALPDLLDSDPLRARRRPRLGVALALLLVGWSCASAAPAPSPAAATADASAAAEAEGPPTRDAEPITRELALATFDSAWSRIHTSYYDPDFRGIDWPGVRDELRPAAADAGTRGELRRVLRQMLSRLGESHFAILTQESVDQIAVDDGDAAAEGSAEGDLALELRWVEGRLTVFRAPEDGPAWAAGVRPGWVLEAIGDREMADWERVVSEAEPGTARTGLETQTVTGAASLLRGPVGSEVTLRVQDGEGADRTLTLTRAPIPGEWVRFGQLPPMVAHLESRRLPVSGGCVGVIEFNIWMVPLVAPFNEAVDDLEECAGIVIDVRGNPGGVGGMVMSTAGSFFAERAPLGVVTSRAGEIRFVAMPRGVDTNGALREAYTGRLAVLIDELSMSTSEIFAAGLKSTGRARLFGTTTPGYALPAMTIRLPSQDVLYHVVSNLTDPEGRRIEGQGVAPDEAVPLRRAALLEGRDAALEAAVGWAGGGG